jgi:hypothetical protein
MNNVFYSSLTTNEIYPLPGETWQHYKGGFYEIVTLANHSETEEPMVIYKSKSFGSIFARPFSMWNEKVEIDNPDAYTDDGIQRFGICVDCHGKFPRPAKLLIPRFTRISK